MQDEELHEWLEGYSKDPDLLKIMDRLLDREQEVTNKIGPYYLDDQKLIYFEDWEKNLRLVVPRNLRSKIMREEHENPFNGAHSGASRMFGRMASNFYWPRMRSEIKRYTTTCDICQKVKPRKHGPYAHLHSLPIPSRPGEVWTMDFIPGLPRTKEGFDNILVVVDKLTKFVILIPTTVDITAQDTAHLLFSKVFTKFGVPREIVSDRDSKWVNSFWQEACRQMRIKRALSTSHHPQTDGQTEVMNQILEVALRCYVNPEKNDWNAYLDEFAFSYNNTPHSSTGYKPSFLLFGYHPTDGVDRLTKHSDDVLRPQTKNSKASEILNFDAEEFLSEITAHRIRAKDSLVLAQATQQRFYNKGRILLELKEGDSVLINLKTLRIHNAESSLGKN